MVGNDILKTCVFSQIQTENGLKNTPKILDDIFASLVQNKTSSDLSKRPQGLTIKPSILGFDTPHYWLCDNRLLCLQDPNNKSNWNVFRECWKQGQVIWVSALWPNSTPPLFIWQTSDNPIPTPPPPVEFPLPPGFILTCLVAQV